MDGLADIGKALATPQMVIMTILGSILILAAIVMMSNKKVTVGAGFAMIAFGIFLIVIGWLNRRLARNSRGYAAFMGARDIFSILR